MNRHTSWSGALIAHYHTLNDRHPSQWPLLPALMLYAGMMILVIFLGWQLYWENVYAQLVRLEQEELQLKQQYTQKIQKAVSLDVLKQQKKLVSTYVTALEKQLPNQSEMEALLSDITQAGTGRGLQFELFKPGRDTAKNYYAELPINIRLTGKYHDIASFASDLAALPRIVSLQNVHIVSIAKNNSVYMQTRNNKDKDKDNRHILTLNAVIKTYRYLHSEELPSRQIGGRP
jgi:type IV pilus assembly protein PilO